VFHGNRSGLSVRCMQSTDFKCYVFVQRDVELQRMETERVQRELLELRAANRRLVEEAGK